MNQTEARIAHKLDTAAAILRSAAREAETLTDQSLADDLHMVANHVGSCQAALITDSKPPSPLERDRA